MPDIGTWSVLGPPVSTLYGTLVSSANDVQNDIRSLPSKLCSSICGQRDDCFITVTLTEGLARQSDLGQSQATDKDLLESLDKIPQTIPKGMKWGDLGWYLIVAEACVFAVGYAYSKLTGRSLIVTWTGELPPSQVTPRPASPDESIDRDTWDSLMNVIKKLKPGDAESLTPHVEVEACKEREWLAVSHFVKGEWVRKTYHVAANLVHTPTSPVARDPLDNHESPERSHSGASSDADLSEPLVLTPPSSDTSGDDPAATVDV